MTVDGRVEATRAVETTIAVRYLGGRGDQPARVPGRSTRLRLARLPERETRSTPTSSPSSRPQDQPSRPVAIDAVFLRRASLDAHRPAPYARRSPGFLADHRSGKGTEARRSPRRPARVRRLLGTEVGRPAPQRREDDGRKGRLGLPALAPRPVRRAMSPSTTFARQLDHGPGLDLGESPPRASTGPIATR